MCPRHPKLRLRLRSLACQLVRHRGPLMSHVSASEHNRSDAVPDRGDGDPSLTQVCKQKRMHQQKRMQEMRERELFIQEGNRAPVSETTQRALGSA